jgi:hypothetical protein
MITNLLVENSALVPVALGLIAVLCVGVGHLLLRARRILWALVTLSVLAIVALTLVPTSGRAFAVCTLQFSLPTFGTVELLANVALFFPAVFFATLATGRPLLMLGAGAALSAAVEAVQALVPAIGRACDTNDWAMNTAGTIAAVLLAIGTMAITSRRQSGRAHEERGADLPPDGPQNPH